MTSERRQDEADAARAHVYALLATLLMRAPAADLLTRLAHLKGDSTPLGQAIADLGKAARDTTAAALEREYHHLFIGIARGELLPYGSYYVTGFLHEKPLARLRGEMAELGMARAEGVPEPEDHIAQLCEMMAGMIAGEFASDLAIQRRFYGRHIEPWAAKFFADLEGAENARFYRAVGSLGKIFMGIESEAFKLAA